MLRLGVVFGGPSQEHAISVCSAVSCLPALSRLPYDIVPVYVSISGEWSTFPLQSVLHLVEKEGVATFRGVEELGEPFSLRRWKDRVDCLFSLMHGFFGEDGTFQGMAKGFGVPFVGASVLGSALGMDKLVQKQLLSSVGLPVTRFTYLLEENSGSIEEIVRGFSFPLFVKPSNAGSSLGISKVTDVKDLSSAAQQAFLYDDKVIIEEGIEGREFECALLGNTDVKTSCIGEIRPSHPFYSYEAKYLDPKGAECIVPAALPKNRVFAMQALAKRAYKALCCEGMARVDFLMDKKGALYINEINTIPGFTPISLYPRLWEASGLPFPKLIDALIELALQRYEKQQAWKSVLPSLLKTQKV